MATTPPADVTELFVAWLQDDPNPLDKALPIVYDEPRHFTQVVLPWP